MEVTGMRRSPVIFSGIHAVGYFRSGFILGSDHSVEHA